jgi:hypothetical protein
MGFELTTLVVIGTDCMGSYKSREREREREREKTCKLIKIVLKKKEKCNILFKN